MENRNIVAAGEVWGLFSRKPTVARNKYEKFLAEGVGQGERSELSEFGLNRGESGAQESDDLRRRDGRILGNAQFVDAVLAKADEQLSGKSRYQQKGIGLNELVEVVAPLLGISPEEVMAPGKQPMRVQARSLLCYWAVRELGYTATAMGRRLKISQPAVSMAVQRGEKLTTEQGWVLEEIMNE